MSVGAARDRGTQASPAPGSAADATMAPVLARFARRYSMDEPALANWLELTLDGLDELGRQPRPRLEARDYEQRIREVARTVGCDSFLVRSVLRYGG